MSGPSLSWPRHEAARIEAEFAGRAGWPEMKRAEWAAAFEKYPRALVERVVGEIIGGEHRGQDGTKFAPRLADVRAAIRYEAERERNRVDPVLIPRSEPRSGPPAEPWLASMMAALIRNRVGAASAPGLAPYTALAKRLGVVLADADPDNPAGNQRRFAAAKTEFRALRARLDAAEGEGMSEAQLIALALGAAPVGEVAA